jgi:hypothetical protein
MKPIVKFRTIITFPILTGKLSAYRENYLCSDKNLKQGATAHVYNVIK